MGALIGILSSLGIIICLIMIGVSFFKKNGKVKKFGTGVIIAFAMFLFAIAITPQPSNENSTTASGTLDKDATIKNEVVKETLESLTSSDNTNTEASTSVNGTLSIHFIDVGQADSILIIDNDKSMLIDAGNNADEDLVVNYINNQGISKLDVVIGTHAHEDHIGGMDKVISSFDIGNVYLPKQPSTTKTYEDVLSAISNKGLKINSPTPNTTFTLNSAKATILAPNSNSYEDINNSSIVVKVNYGNNSFLFMGDAEELSENEILNKGYNVAADLIKLGHHGSSSSSSENFLNSVKAKYGIISIGAGNTYGHPTKEVMELLKNKEITVYRTDENSTIIATSDGKNITFNVNPGSYNYASSNESSSNENNSSNETPSTPTPKPENQPNTTENSGENQYLDSNGNGLIKGNASSMIYHMPGGAYYDRTKAEAWFKTESEAQAAGYRRSKK